MRFLRKIGQRGTLTVPSELRDALSIEEGDIIEFEIINVVRRAKNRTAAIDATPTSEHTVTP